MIKIVDVSYGNEAGFNQAIELAADALANVKLIQEKKLICTLSLMLSSFSSTLHVLGKFNFSHCFHLNSVLLKCCFNYVSKYTVSFELSYLIYAAKLFEEISQDTNKYVFGVDETLHGLEMGAVETLIVWENLDVQRIRLRNTQTLGLACLPISKYTELCTRT